MTRPLTPPEGAYVTLVLRVEGPDPDSGGVRLEAVDRAGEPVREVGIRARLTDDYALMTGHPLETLGGYPVPERYTPEGINRPGVSWGHVAVPGPEDVPVLTEEIINGLADKARELILKRLTFQAAMEQGARDG